MIGKSAVVAASLLTILAVGSFGGLTVFAWHATVPTNLCTPSPPSSPSSYPCYSSGSVNNVAGCASWGTCMFALPTAGSLSVYDSVTIWDPAEVSNGDNGAFYGCGSNWGWNWGWYTPQPCPITGTVTFKLYGVSGANPASNVCTETTNANGDTTYNLPGSNVIQIGLTQTYNSFPSNAIPPYVVNIPSPYSIPYNTQYSYFISYVTYNGNYENGGSNYVSSCEYFTVTPPPSYGTPQFPLGSLGMLALLGMMVPLMLLARSRFAKGLPF